MNNERYLKALKEANKAVDHFSANVDIQTPKLLLQIYRDYLFQRYSGDLSAVISRPRILDILKSFFMAFSHCHSGKNVICVQRNMFNNGAVDKIRLSFSLCNMPLIFSDSNILLSFKYNALIRSIALCSHPRHIRRIRHFRSCGMPFIIYLIYLQQSIHLMLSKRTFGTIFYFSKGSPSYGRFLSSQCHEVQHGVIHKGHPIVNPYIRPRGKFIVLNDFGINLDQVPSIEVESLCQENRISLNQETLAFAPLRNENSFLSAVNVLNDSVTFIFHPRSSHFNTQFSLDEKIDAIQASEIVYSGLSTAIFDIFQLNKKALRVILFNSDLADFHLESNDVIVVTTALNSFYNVNILPEQVIIYD